MPSSRIVVMGASAGGLEAVSAAIAGLAPAIDASVLVVIHTSAGDNNLADVLGRATSLPVQAARDRGAMRRGHVYVAVSNRHLVVEDGAMRVVSGPRQHGFRPAVDTLFLSAAEAAGARVAGVILSGALSDGVAGLRAIKRAGGRAIVQHPEQAAFPSMPLSALREVEVDAVLRAGEIGADLTAWAAGRAARGHERSRRLVPARRSRRATREFALPAGPAGAARRHDTGGGHDARAPHALVPISCPSCGGALSATAELGTDQYECHVGHRFNADSLAAVLDGQVESVLWTAVRALQEKAILRRRMHAGAGSRTLAALSDRWLEDALEAESQAEQIRRLIEAVPSPAADQVADTHVVEARAAAPGPPSAAARRPAATRGSARRSARRRTASGNGD